MCPTLTQPDRLKLDLPTPEGWKAELTLVLVIYWDGLPISRQLPIHVGTTWLRVEHTIFLIVCLLLNVLTVMPHSYFISLDMYLQLYSCHYSRCGSGSGCCSRCCSCCCVCCSGVINTVVEGSDTMISSAQSTCPLQHSHTVVGHSKAVLSVFATGTYLYTASKGLY